MLGALAAVWLIAAPAAHAEFGVTKFDAGTCAKNTEPAPQCTPQSTTDYFFQQSAGHPEFGITDFAFTTTAPLGMPDGAVKNVRVDLPPGLSVNPEATPKCTKEELTSSQGCAADTQVGVSYLRAISGLVPVWVNAPVYNIVQPDGMPALFAFKIPVIGVLPEVVDPVYIEGGVAWDSDYHESFDIRNVPPTIPLVESRLVFDGHAGDGTFITLPSPCEGPQTTNLRVESQVGELKSYSSTTPVGVTGCADIPFAPTVGISSDTRAAGAPAGVTIDVQVPQNPDGKDKPNASTLRDVAVTLPEGMAINPSAATGLEGCSDAQLGIGTTAPVACPAGSEIGTFSVETPVLPEHALSGKVFLGTPRSGDPLSGDEYRLMLDAESPRYGVSVRLLGHVRADPVTGRLTASFTDNPQVPVNLIRVALRGGPRAPLVNPRRCGTPSVSADLTGWSGKVVTATAPYPVDASCSDPNTFAPSLSAAPSTPKAGAKPSFTLTIGRTDSDQTLGKLDVSLPPGLVAKTAGIPLCPNDRADAGTCDEGSRIGSTSVTAGAGSEPFGLGGRVYLTGPYRDAPYGLSVVVPAVAGPFDLGTVVVRASIYVDPVDAHVRVVSEQLPTILDGVPLLVRSVGVTIDRPDTMRNPTSCAPMAIGATVSSSEGGSAKPSTPFTATECAALGFAPKIGIALTDSRETLDGKHPGVDSTVTQAAGQANIHQVQVALPTSLALDPENAESLCEYADGLKGTCPASSIIGSATAVSPLLPTPLSGPVYFVKGVRFNAKGAPIRTLPTLLLRLKGDVALDIRASTEVDSKNRLVTTFASLPDAAVSSFRLKLRGGKHGILVVTHAKDLCAGKQVASVVSAGQNGKQTNVPTTLGTPCPASPKVGRARALSGQRGVRLSVRAPAAGRLVLKGASGRLASVTKKVSKAGTVSVTLRWTKAAKRSAARHRAGVSERVSVRFVARSGAGRTVRSNAVRLRHR